MAGDNSKHDKSKKPSPISDVSKKRQDDKLFQVDSQTPTALIAPDDFVNYMPHSNEKRAKPTKAQKDLAYPSDAPTALIAPHDFVNYMA